ncbi:MAG: biotin--[acetyl-CoA-carboxylase] ligase [Anaerolineaceae bacterium]|nr:biotin--[acetyl-CoA-carboxylase] ligase [Anaerolineaceae bacterium]
MDEKILRTGLINLNIPEIRYFPTIGSTNDEALDWVEAGAGDGSIVIADHQSAGRGRMNRSWITRAGTSLAVSVILRPKHEELHKITLFSPLAAVGLCQTLDEMFGLKAMIKWPNDVLLDNKKVAGILVEGYWVAGTLQGVVIGIGVNITAKAVPWNIKLLYPATSI